LRAGLVLAADPPDRASVGFYFVAARDWDWSPPALY
jgi:hypothetical protein